MTIERKNFKWTKNKLFLGDGYIGKVFEAEDGIWWIEFSNKDKSADYYNLDRAKDNLVKLTMKERNMFEDEEIRENDGGNG